MHKTSSESASTRRIWLAALLSSSLCGILIFLFCPASIWESIREIRLEWAAAGLSFFVLNLVARGMRLSTLAGKGQNASVSQWMHCAARHQFMFSILPSASGDISFPYLGNKLCGLDYGNATRVIALYRVQDMVALAGLLLFGLALQSSELLIITSATIVIPIALYWSEGVIGGAFRFLLTSVCKVPKIRQLRIVTRLETLVENSESESTKLESFVRFRLVAWTILSWSLSAATFWCLFAMVGEYLPIGKICLIVAALNLFGTLNAFTIGGFGIGESALATILIYLQYSYDSAVSIALIVRPSALGVTLVGCLVIELLIIAAKLGVRSTVVSAKPSH
ncbi:flippase-like domain-containing protein [Planctomicrobium sp.]|nr:flippase-like domain-containing protein [Planctomicrobium sp.]